MIASCLEQDIEAEPAPARDSQRQRARVRRAIQQAEEGSRQKAVQKSAMSPLVYWLLTLGVPLLFSIAIGNRMTPGRFQLSARLFGPWMLEYEDGTYALVDSSGRGAYHQQLNSRDEYVVTSEGDVYKQSEKANGEVDMQIVGHLRSRD